MEELKA
jgi:hypothetical protein